MMLYVTVDGERRPLFGRYEDIIDRCRELRSDGHEVQMAKQPKQRDLGARGSAIASSHRR